MSAIKITLSRGDLESLLLAENGEIKVEIGQQIADAFAGKYLKSIIHDAFTKEVSNFAQKIAQEQWADFHVRTSSYKVEPAPQAKQLIRNEIDSRLNKYTEDLMNKGIAKATQLLTEKFTPQRLAEAIEWRVTANVDREIEKGVREAINRALKPLPPSPKGE